MPDIIVMLSSDPLPSPSPHNVIQLLWYQFCPMYTENQVQQFRHPCNSQTTVKTTLVLLYKLILYCCLWLIKLTTPAVLVLSRFSIAKVPKSAVVNISLTSWPQTPLPHHHLFNITMFSGVDQIRVLNTIQTRSGRTSEWWSCSVVQQCKLRDSPAVACLCLHYTYLS